MPVLAVDAPGACAAWLAPLPSGARIAGPGGRAQGPALSAREPCTDAAVAHSRDSTVAAMKQASAIAAPAVGL